MVLPPPDDVSGPNPSGIPTGWKATGPNPTPPARQLLDAAASSFASQLQPNDLRTVTGQGSCDSTLAVAAQGPCEVPTTEELTAAIPVYSTQLKDSYLQPVPGSPQPGTKLALTQVGNQNGVLSHVVQESCDVPQQPFLSKLIEGPGAQVDTYGDMPIPDPANPGQALDAPGAADKVVKGYRSSPRPERFKRPRFYPGPGVTFDPQIPPFDQPTLVQSVNNGATLGDTAQRRWGCTYTDGAHESEMGPLSDWALGYLAASVTVPAVPTGSAWSHITAINLYRNTAADPETFKLAHSFGTGGGTITDTTADGSLGAAYASVNTAIKAGGSRSGGNYVLATDRWWGPGGIGTNLNNFSGGAYTPWDTCANGSNAYLDPANTDGLTIPPGGDGDYFVHVLYSLGTPIDTHDFALYYTISIELFRGATQEMYFFRQDAYQNLSDTTTAQYWQFPTCEISALVPATQAGDVIKTNILVRTVDLTDASILSVFVTGNDGTSALGPETWVSIAPVG